MMGSLDCERSRHFDISYRPLHIFGTRSRFRYSFSHSDPSSSDTLQDLEGYRKNGFNKVRRDSRSLSSEMSNTSDPLHQRRPPRPEFKSRRLRPSSTAVHHQDHYDHGPQQLANQLHQLHLADRQMPLSEQSSNRSMLGNELSVGTSNERNGASYNRHLNIFSEQAIENNSLRGSVMQARDRLQERFRAASLVSNRNNSNASTAPGVENYVANEEGITLANAENWETDVRNWLASRNGQLEELLQMEFLPSRGSKAPALSKIAIKNLPREVFVLKSKTRDSVSGDEMLVSEQEDCPVCLEQFSLGEHLLRLPCSHRFHLDCLTPWLIICGECPYCRANVLWNQQAPAGELEQL